jgi:hypothetical protein
MVTPLALPTREATVAWLASISPGRAARRRCRTEAVVGSDDQHPGTAELVAERVQQVGRTVQADGRLPGAGGALDAQRLGQAGADDGVLLGLDGGDDVAHRPGPRALDLRLQDVGRDFGLGTDQVLVLVRGHPPVGKAEPAAPAYAHRLAGPRLVEGPGHAGAPVDHHRLSAGFPGHVPAADVQRLVLLGPRSAA